MTFLLYNINNLITRLGGNNRDQLTSNLLSGTLSLEKKVLLW